MFANIKINIVIYYFLTVLAFLVLEYYLLEVLHVKSLLLLGVVFVCIVILSGIFLSKFATEPLIAYVKNLQNLSKETLHELNLPISTIKTNSQMLQKKFADDEKMVRRLGRIESACEMLQQRYNELDYFIKMQAQQDIKEDISLEELVLERVQFLKSIYPDFTFDVELREYRLHVDRVGLGKVIDNIVDNGVKYSGDSKKIDIYFENSTLYIRDYGIGMDEVELLRIYDTFYQADETKKGFGIGLAMVKRFCERNGIGLHVNSTPKKGTTVLLQFKDANGSK